MSKLSESLERMARRGQSRLNLLRASQAANNAELGEDTPDSESKEAGIATEADIAEIQKGVVIDVTPDAPR